jgi:RNase H-fold protein (predicted Holliday junction resolvase)
MSEKTVLAIDPGSSKCGMALVQRDEKGKLSLLWRSVAPTDLVIPKLHEAYAANPYQLIIVGGGTNSQKIVHRIREHLTSMALLVVDERDTTLQARERYWEHNPRRGWRRMLPATLQVPPEPVDDFVALILAERVLLAGD